MFLKKIAIFLGSALIVFALILMTLPYWHQSGIAVAYDSMVKLSQEASETATPFPTATQTPVPSALPTSQPSPTPTIVQPSYILGNTIDLSSGQPVALTVDLPEGGQLQTNWAGTLPYKGDDDLETVFAPDKGVVYSYLGDVTTTWAHSGTNIYGQRYFASGLDLYLRKKPGNITMTMAEANEKANALKGATAYLCQVNTGEVQFLSDYDLLSCTGKLLKLKVTAIAIVPRERVDEYDSSAMVVDQWLTTNFPGSGFEELNADNGWLISFCVGKMADQSSDGTPSYLYNRGVIGFEIENSGE